MAHVVSEAAKANVLDKVNIYSAGAGAELGNMSITYYQGSVTTPIVRVDDVVKRRTIDILSVDVHGGATNYDVLLGGNESLGRGLFKSIWCELFPDPRPMDAPPLHSDMLLQKHCSMVGCSIKKASLGSGTSSMGTL